MRTTQISDIFSSIKGFVNRWPTPIYMFFITVACFLAYQNSFHGDFHFDDMSNITTHRGVQTWPPWKLLMGPRPFSMITFAINFRLGGISTFGYHVVNFGIHLSVGLLVFLLVRRTLLTPKLKDRFQASADRIAFAVAVVWTVHPLNTECVTYIVQREEALMAFFYLLSIYFWSRGGTTNKRPQPWYLASIISYMIGFEFKEINITTPVVLLLYDRAFLAKSYKEILKKREFYYVLYALMGVILLVIASHLLDPVASRQGNVGFHLPVRPHWYFWTQMPIIIHYLKLSLLPLELNLDYYSWAYSKTFWRVAPEAIFVFGLFFSNIILLKVRPALAFLGLTFFVILAPTSSIYPLADFVAERRMYAPLICVITAVVLAGNALINWLAKHSWSLIVKFILILAIMIPLCLLTRARNSVYDTRAKMLLDTIVKDGQNARSFYNLSTMHFYQNNFEDAIPLLEASLNIFKDDTQALYHIAQAHRNLKQYDKALEYLERSIAVYEDDNIYKLMGIVYNEQGNLEKAVEYYEKALVLNPHDGHNLNNIANTYARLGQLDKARLTYKKALILNPENENFIFNIAQTYLQEGKAQEALKHYDLALSVKPNFEKAKTAKETLLAEIKSGKSQQGNYETITFDKPISLDEFMEMREKGEI